MLPHEIYNKLYWSKIPGMVYIPVPKDKLDPELTVIAVLLDSPIDLYHEKVGAIKSNLRYKIAISTEVKSRILNIK